jgi:hypothetical protein
MGDVPMDQEIIQIPEQMQPNPNHLSGEPSAFGDQNTSSIPSDEPLPIISSIEQIESNHTQDSQ